MYFTNCQTLAELKDEYRKVVMILHPDKGGDTQAFQEMRNEFESKWEIVKNLYINKDGEVSTLKKENGERPTEFYTIIEYLMGIEGLELSVACWFLWIEGKTYENKDKIKACPINTATHKIGFSRDKNAWYIAPSWYRKFNNKAKYSMQDIKRTWGQCYSATTGRQAEEDERRLIAA